MKLGAKTLSDSFRFGQHLPEPGRKRARHGNRFVWQGIGHESVELSRSREIQQDKDGTLGARPTNPPFIFEFLCEFSQMRRAIYPGSFDPVTNGHLDVIERARKLFDEVVVAVAHNDEKQPLFSLGQRLDLLQQTAGRVENVRIAEFSGLLVEFARAQNAGAVIRGLRAVSDFEFEFQMALMNRSLNAAVETIFLMPKEEYTYLSSRIVKEIARLGGNISTFVPTCVVKALSGKFSP